VSVRRWRHAGHTPPVSKVFHSCPRVQDQRSSLRGDQPQCGHRMRGGPDVPSFSSSSSPRSIQQGAKTKLSQSSVTMHPILAQLLKDWRSESTFAQESDFVFASVKICGRKPRCGSMVVESYLRPAAERAEVIEVRDRKAYIDGEFAMRFGFHTFRHSLTSWLMANGENPQIVRAMLRWTNLNMLAHYTHRFKADKLEAQGTVLEKLVGSRNTSDREPNREREPPKARKLWWRYRILTWRP